MPLRSRTSGCWRALPFGPVVQPDAGEDDEQDCGQDCDIAEGSLRRDAQDAFEFIEQLERIARRSIQLVNESKDRQTPLAADFE